MAIPQSLEARLYYRSAFGRFEDAQILLSAERTTGSIYLAGYCIECILKALILSSISPRTGASMIETFRGVKAHNYRWLLEQYHINGGPRFSREINQNFLIVDYWSTDFRYLPQPLRLTQAHKFLRATEILIEFIDQRI